MCSYKSEFYPNDFNRIDKEIGNLFIELIHNLEAMDKNAMNGKCEFETLQMENFLKEYFHFENLPNEYIVQGVKSFQIKKPISTFHDETIIKFPSEKSNKTFDMTIKEILEWKKSFIVYACQDNDLLINKEFLLKALQGQSKEGEEAFQMKFVVRISQCPILMEFDGKLIERKLNENWPNLIQLVSVTGIDFAGRIHDINDILSYIHNWNEVYYVDSKINKPYVHHGRDFLPKKNISVQLNENRLFKDLIRMCYIRLYASNQQNIEIIVETGIGLGIFSGKQIGIDHKIRLLSAKAIKYVIEHYSSDFKNIRAIIFALPIFETDEKTSTFYAFTQIFQNQYKGSIPILIVDQDMHRLTVYIAKKGFRVSELNPADSHGVFGEYWQNRGPAVEEKLALTTLGLIIQHHFFNPNYVLNQNNYQLVNTNHLNDLHTILPLFTDDQVNSSSNHQISNETNILMYIFSIPWFIFSLIWNYLRQLK